MFSLYVECPEQEKDLVIAELWEEGSAGITDSEGGLRAFFEDEATAGRLAAKFRVEYRVEEQRDWIAVSREKVQPVLVGSRFFLAPAWRDDPAPPGRIRIEIDPGQAFGTGLHETTQLCLEALEREVKPGTLVLDVGTGSGILAHAAILLGAGHAFGCDIDPIATAIAHKRVPVFTGSVDAIAPMSVDLVVANINPDVSPRVMRVLKPGGVLIASGFELHEAAAVAERLGAAGKVTSKNNWSCLTLVAGSGMGRAPAPASPRPPE